MCTGRSRRFCVCHSGGVRGKIRPTGGIVTRGLPMPGVLVGAAVPGPGCSAPLCNSVPSFVLSTACRLPHSALLIARSCFTRWLPLCVAFGNPDLALGVGSCSWLVEL